METKFEIKEPYTKTLYYGAEVKLKLSKTITALVEFQVDKQKVKDDREMFYWLPKEMRSHEITLLIFRAVDREKENIAKELRAFFEPRKQASKSSA